MTVKALSPDEVKPIQTSNIPDAVVQVFNELLVKHWDGTTAQIMQDDVLEKLLVEHNIERHDAFAKRWLDIEPIFAEQGWLVKYVKGPYYDTSPRYFHFERDK